RYPTARGPASASIDDAVDARTPAKLLKALPREFVLEPKSINIRRLPRLMPGKPDPPELNKPDTLLRIPPSDVGSLTRAKARVMNERSLDLLANAPRTVGSATPRPFDTAASDSPYVVLTFATTSGVISAFRPSIRLDGCMGIAVSMETSSCGRRTPKTSPNGQGFPMGACVYLAAVDACMRGVLPSGR